MPQTYAQNKPHIYKYAETHTEKIKEIQKRAMKKYYQLNKEKMNAQRTCLNRVKREFETFRNILLED